MTQRGWYGVDLDGTLAAYDSWRGPAHIGEPIPRMTKLVRRLRRLGFEVRIMTARVCSAQPDPYRVIARAAIEAWSFNTFGEVLPVTSEKDFQMLALIDDRVCTVRPNTGRLVSGELLLPYEALLDLDGRGL